MVVKARGTDADLSTWPRMTSLLVAEPRHPQGLARASQVESVGRLWSSCAPKQTEFQWTGTVGGPGDGYRFRERHAVRDLLVRPQIVRGGVISVR